MKLEKEISKEVKNYLDNLQKEGAVLWSTRLQSGKVQTKFGSWLQLSEPGTPDFVAVLKGCKVYFIETKSDSGKQSPEQVAFQRRVVSWAIYEVVRDSKQVYDTVELATGHYKRKLDGIEYEG